jgi:hypothetical protein
VIVLVVMGAPEALGGASPLGRRPGFGGGGFRVGKKEISLVVFLFYEFFWD